MEYTVKHVIFADRGPVAIREHLILVISAQMCNARPNLPDSTQLESCPVCRLG